MTRHERRSTACDMTTCLQSDFVEMSLTSVTYCAVRMGKTSGDTSEDETRLRHRNIVLDPLTFPVGSDQPAACEMWQLMSVNASFALVETFASTTRTHFFDFQRLLSRQRSHQTQVNFTIDSTVLSPAQLYFRPLFSPISEHLPPLLLFLPPSFTSFLTFHMIASDSFETTSPIHPM